MSNARTIATFCGLGLLTLATAGCEEQVRQAPSGLNAPVAIEAVRGEVCLPGLDSEDFSIAPGALPRCADVERPRGFGLVVNTVSERLGVVDLTASIPRLVNLDTRIPGITQIKVGPRPIDVAASPDGTAALVANQGDNTLSAVDLWTMRTLPEAVELPGSPVAIETFENASSAGIAALLAAPNTLWVGPSLGCERPEGNIDRRGYTPENCTWAEGEAVELALPGQPTDLALDAEAGMAAIVYGDLADLSLVALSDEALGEATCLEGESAPCEVARIDWAGERGTLFGATEVAFDPSGAFIYVLEQAESQVVVIDRARGELIDARLASEPTTVGASDIPGIALVRQARTMAPVLERRVLVDGPTALVVHRHGLMVASDNGSLYRVDVLDVECAFEAPEGLLSDEAFASNTELRDAHPEARCLTLPALPLASLEESIDTSDEALLNRRVIEDEDRTLAITPIFALRDAAAAQGRLVGRATCEQPDELRQAMSQAAAGTATALGCGSPLIDQPVAPDVDEELRNFIDAPRAELMQLARAQLQVEGDEVQAEINRQVYDVRLRNESWTLTFEGALPGVGSQERGIIATEGAGKFLSGGVDYCAAGVEVGDRLRILSEPAEGGGCADFQGSETFLTYEITEIGATTLTISPIDEEGFAAMLPTRECFDTGLRYEVRPQEQWIATGTQSGFASVWERDGESCVLKEDALNGRIQGRVAAGEVWEGPYLALRIREGEVGAREGLSYTFRVDRAFAVDGASLGTALPSELVVIDDIGAGRQIALVDAGTSTVYIAPLDNILTGGDFVR
ncbi:hypothetical protein FRC98_17650 [Lujinxingia vulgaris]|uniref:Alkaline phosphatase n=1 Tax=Lujinxingia vulgaris TaxID=2600176 RepID=A0A5C6X3T1_9DELT|nr:hypothetical protein [Lujinxingia vulgaris]TXD34946.1 hypothetical protein FRC98_17650 [Lujinxingia vulgaris]